MTRLTAIQAVDGTITNAAKKNEDVVMMHIRKVVLLNICQHFSVTSSMLHGYVYNICVQHACDRRY